MNNASRMIYATPADAVGDALGKTTDNMEDTLDWLAHSCMSPLENHRMICNVLFNLITRWHYELEALRSE